MPKLLRKYLSFVSIFSWLWFANQNSDQTYSIFCWQLDKKWELYFRNISMDWKRTFVLCRWTRVGKLVTHACICIYAIQYNFTKSRRRRKFTPCIDRNYNSPFPGSHIIIISCKINYLRLFFFMWNNIY